MTSKPVHLIPIFRTITEALLGQGGGVECSYIRVLPDDVLLKSTVMTTEKKFVGQNANI